MNLIETYSITDTFFKDIGSETDYAAWTNEGNMTVERTTETKLTPTSSSSQATRYLELTNYTTPFIMEMDLCLTYGTGGGSSLFSIRQYSTNKGGYSPNQLGLQNSIWVHLKLEITDETLTAIVDGTRKNSVSHGGTFNRFYFTIPGNYNWIIQYSNFLIYSSG